MIVTSVFGRHICHDLELVDLQVVDNDMVEDSTITAVTADNKEEPESASDSCCDIESDAPTDEQ